MRGRKPTVPLPRLRYLYEVERLSIDEIARRTGLNRSGVSARLKSAGVNMRGPGKCNLYPAEPNK
jgi:hypothetical protein